MLVFGTIEASSPAKDLGILVFLLPLTTCRWMLPDRASPDRSREAGLKIRPRSAPACLHMRIVSNTSMASGLTVVVKGNRSVGAGRMADLEPLRAQARRIGIPNPT